MLSKVRRWHGGQLVVAVIGLLLVGIVAGFVGLALLYDRWPEEFSRRERCARMIDGRMESSRQWDRTTDSLFSLAVSDSLSQPEISRVADEYMVRQQELRDALLRGADCDRIAKWYVKQRYFLTFFLFLGMPLLMIGTSLGISFIWFGARRQAG